MAGKYFLFVLVNLFAVWSFAQHCAWDGSSMVMLDIKKNSNQKIKKVYLLDSAGAVVMNKHYFGEKVEMDSARFWKNPPGMPKNTAYKRTGLFFPFAKDYEILELGGHDQPLPYSVLIIYTSDGTTMRKDIPLLSNHIHQLCTLNKELWSGNVKPMSVIL
jgi:hypothetical protein